MRDLGLGLRSPIVSGAVAALVLGTNLATMAVDLTFYDSPELALVAHQLGLGHPIGQPLHTLLGFLVTRVGDPLIALTAMSSVFGALCVLPAIALSEKLTPQSTRTWPAAVAIGLFALHRIAWEPATRVEVYSLAAFFGLWALARAAGRSDRSRGLSVGVALGLAFSANAVIGAAHAIGAIVVLMRNGERLRDGWRFGAGMLVGALPYLYLLRAPDDPRTFVWGADSLASYLRGADYAHNQGIGLAAFADHLMQLASWSASEASLPLAVAGTLGVIVLGRSNGLAVALPIAAAVAIAFVAANVVFHPDVPDYRGYLAAPWFGAGAGLGAIGTILVARGARFRLYGGLLAAAPLAALIASPTHLIERRDDPSLARAIAEAALDEAPRNAIVLVEADHWVAPLLYVQEAEHRRTDVVVIARGLASSGWYWDHVFARHPSLVRAELAGPGGRDGRIARLLLANPDRAVLTESWRHANTVGLTPCGVGWLVHARGICGAPDAATARLATFSARGEAYEVLARIDLARGEALWRLGYGDATYAAFLAGLRDVPHPRLPERARPLGGPLPAFARPAAIHDPARNVVAAALLCDAIGDRETSTALVARARAMGLDAATLLRR